MVAASSYAKVVWGRLENLRREEKGGKESTKGRRATATTTPTTTGRGRTTRSVARSLALSFAPLTFLLLAPPPAKEEQGGGRAHAGAPLLRLTHISALRAGLTFMQIQIARRTSPKSFDLRPPRCAPKAKGASEGEGGQVNFFPLQMSNVKSGGRRKEDVTLSPSVIHTSLPHVSVRCLCAILFPRKGDDFSSSRTTRVRWECAEKSFHLPLSLLSSSLDRRPLSSSTFSL